MVVYHGKAPWRVPPTLAEAADADDELRPYLADFRYALVDLGRIDDVDLSRNGELRETLRTLGRAALALGLDDLVALVCYMLGEPNEVEAQVLREGVREGQARTLLRQLDRRFGPVSESVHQRVSAAGLDALDQWLDRVLDAPTLDAVFDEGRTH